MIGSIDLVLATLERALSVSVVPATTDADARQEAALGALFARWLRDVVDHAADAERASLRDSTAALGELTALASQTALPADSRAAIEAARALAGEREPERLAEVRNRSAAAKAALARALRAARDDGDADLAARVRAILMRFADREIQRELAFARATGMDPDAATVPPLAEVLRR